MDQGHFHAEGFVDLQAGTSRIQADQLDMYETTAADGKVTRVLANVGQQVERGQRLAEFEADPV